jgi:peptidoglycan/xylan/chitin deacetylase (PgdA/CDA1 family)
MLLKKAARVVLHKLGGLAHLRRRHRREFGVLMFHSFGEKDEANLEAICSHITRYFEPVSLSAIVDAMDGKKALPDHAITVTVDDGYRSFLQYGHPTFRRNRIPATVYAVGGFSDGQLWLWTDQIEFGLRHTTRSSIRTTLLGDGEPWELPLNTPDEKADSMFRLSEKLKSVPNDRRVAFLAEFGSLCGVEIPPTAPAGREAMTWDELRAVAAEGTEIGCHTQTHPILSRLSNPLELEREIHGARKHLEERLGFEVRHFCYPNGRAMDIGEAATDAVRDAGFASAVTCAYGFNGVAADRLRIRRIPLLGSLDLQYAEETLAGLHLNPEPDRSGLKNAAG